MLIEGAGRIVFLAFLTLAASCATKPGVDVDKQYTQAFQSVGSVHVSVLGSALDSDDRTAVQSIYELLVPEPAPSRAQPLGQTLTITGKPVSSVYCRGFTGPFDGCPRNDQIQVSAGYEFTIVFARRLDGKTFTFERYVSHVPKAIGTTGPWSSSPPDVEKAQRYSRQSAFEDMLGYFCNDAMRMFAVELPYKTLASSNPKISRACLEWNPDKERQKRIARSVLAHPELSSDLHLRAAALLEPNDR